MPSYVAPSNVQYHNDSKSITFDIQVTAGSGTYENYTPGNENQWVSAFIQPDGQPGSCGGCGAVIENNYRQFGAAPDTQSYIAKNVISNYNRYKIGYYVGTYSSTSSETVTIATGGPMSTPPMPNVFLPTLEQLGSSGYSSGGCTRFVTWLKPPYDALDGTGAADFRLRVHEIQDPNDPQAPALPEGTGEWGTVNISTQTPDLITGTGEDTRHHFRLTQYTYDVGPLVGQSRGLPSKKWFEAVWEYRDGACNWLPGPITRWQQPWAEATIVLVSQDSTEDGRWSNTYQSVLTHGDEPHYTNWEVPQGATQV